MTHSKYCWRAFRGYQHRWPWAISNPKIEVFQWIFRDFRLRYTLDQDNLHIKLSALNAYFNGVRLDP